MVAPKVTMFRCMPLQQAPRELSPTITRSAQQCDEIKSMSHAAKLDLQRSLVATFSQFLMYRLVDNTLQASFGGLDVEGPPQAQMLTASAHSPPKHRWPHCK